MLRKIESLRKKPKHIRNRYAFGIAAFVTLGIGLVWGINFPSRFSEQAKESSQNPENTNSLQDALSEVGASISAGLAEIKNQAEMIDVTSGTSTFVEEEAAVLNASSTDMSETSSDSMLPKKDVGRIILIEGRASTSAGSAIEEQ